MKKQNDKDQKDNQPEVYVVTRDRRRTSDWNFTNEEDAKREAQYWIGICRNYDPSSKVSIVKTNKPRKIR
tara:strand:- start:2128 stop:2337 length:210 start_codon:yes stop_codon:yes gene_type:complete